MKFSVRAGSLGGVEHRVAFAQAAEQAGFDQIWFGNDIFGTSGMVTLTAIAAGTERIHMGVGVLDPVSLHPAQIAMFAAALQNFSGGRFHLGIGAGSDVFFGFAGLQPPRPLQRTREAVVAVRILLEGGTPASDPAAGSGWQDQARLHEVPDQRPPIYVGAIGPKLLAMAGQHADGALPLCLPPERFLRARALIEQGAGDRDLSGFDLPACIWCSIDDDGEVARRRLAVHIARYSGSLAVDALVEEGFRPDEFARVQEAVLRDGEEAAAGLVTDDMMRLGIAGSADDVVAKCLELIETGVEHISFGPPLGPDPKAALAELGRVLPALRQRADVSAGAAE